MVTITNGDKTFRVTAGAVKPYEDMGFRVVRDTPLEDNEDSGMGSSSDEGYIEELLEKPLSQWTNEEVKYFVKVKEIDTSGAQKISQVRGIIKTYLDEQAKNA